MALSKLLLQCNILYEGISVVTNYCKKLSVGDQLTGKLFAPGEALVNIDGGVKQLWLPFKKSVVFQWTQLQQKVY